MATQSSIEWTDTTWNPLRGCTMVSEGCTNCYAMRMAHRFSGPDAAYEGLTRLSSRGPVWTGKIRLVPELLDEPLRWRKPRLVFVNSMSDLFHEKVPLEFIQRVFDVMKRTPQHRYQLLTKRAERLRDLGHELPWPDNVWMGVSVESPAAASRIDALRAVPAAVRFLSIEPLIARLPGLQLRGIHWVIVGGESGPGARPMDIEWVREIRDACRRQEVPFFFKQWGGVRKKETGRVLDGRTWDQMPQSHPAQQALF